MLLKATHEQTKRHNTRLVLRTIYQNEGVSRADIARATALTRPTVSSIVAELLERNVVAEVGQGPSAGGKPPTLLNIAQNTYLLACLDLGGAAFRGALVTLRGEIVARISLPADPDTTPLEQAYTLMDALRAAATVPLLGIGIGTPGVVDPLAGVVMSAVNLGWRNLALKSLFEGRYRLPVHVANDSQAAALAEYTFGGERSSRHGILIRIGQGIGAGVVLNGQLFSGDGFGAGEIGHLVVREGGDPCTCGNRGCLETTSSTRALLLHAAQALGRAELEWDELVAAFAAGDPTIQMIVAEAGRCLGVAVASLVAAFNIHSIVVAGRVAQFGPAFLEATLAATEQRALRSLTTPLQLRFTTLHTDIVMLGCSALVLNHELGVV